LHKTGVLGSVLLEVSAAALLGAARCFPSGVELHREAGHPSSQDTEVEVAVKVRNRVLELGRPDPSRF